MQNYPMPLNPMQRKQKKKNFTILGSRGKPLEDFTIDLKVLKSILLKEDKEQ